MKKIANLLPEYIKVLLSRLLISLVLLYISRIIFLSFNSGSFPNLKVQDFFIALWFDMITVSLCFLPYYILFLLPIPIRGYKPHRTFFKVLFHLTNGLMLALNLMDIEYFKYTSKRSTSDLFSILGAGSDFKQLISSFITDFWFIILIFGILLFASEFFYRKTQRTLSTFRTKSSNFYKTNIIFLVIVLPILILIGRGGIGLRPTGIIEASKYTQSENTAFILTTPFTMIKSLEEYSLAKVEFMKDEELTNYFNPIKSSSPQNVLPDSTNVVIIILESFGKEFVGAYNNGEGYTPFLDSILKQSLMFKNGFSNGKKSIEAVPAIIASMPTLMDSPYISSAYGDNNINSLPNILAQFGYESAFFHGATNGSMRFDAFAAHAGFNHYFGRFEYNNDKHFDKTWGILDEYFNPWSAKKMTELKEPFFSTLFTLSSHHPYFIPEHMRDKVKKGPQPLCASINYGDYALKLFFEEAKKQPWYKNTVFFILADHTPATTTAVYNTRTQMYRIPIAIYHPEGKVKPEVNDEIFQQMDILPTVLDLLNIKTNFYSFGNSHYSNTEKEAISYIEGTYYYYKNGLMTTFSNGKARNLYDFTVMSTENSDSFSTHKEEVKENELRIKSMIQTYNRDLIMNQTIVNEKENSIYRKPNIGNKKQE